MEKLLREIIQKINTLETTVLGIKDEHGHMLRAILGNKEVNKAEMDKLQIKVATVEGVLNGFANSLESIRKTQ